MLVKFSLHNWMSFRDRASFSMIASRERQHRTRVPRVKKYQTSILPIAALYGGNASGKTNLFRALNFVKRFVIYGSPPDSLIPVEVFRLDPQAEQLPTCFVIELLTDKTIYELSFAVSRKEVLEEKIVRISSKSEKTLYERNHDRIRFFNEYKKDQRLRFVAKGTRENQLFLTNSVSQKVEIFKPVYDWFRNNLELVAPDARFEPFDQFVDEGSPLYMVINQALPALDTGITRLGTEEIPFESAPLPEPIKTRLKEEVKEGMTVRLMDPAHEKFLISRKDGELRAKKIITYHTNENGTDVKFDMSRESDGSMRVIDLLPDFVDISAPDSRRVYVFDEIDRSLHPLLVRQMLEAYLEKCSARSRAQMLFTTHDVQLMDQQLLRRDEMWVTERTREGASTLIPFSDYKDIRYDKDIRKSYLQGRLGGIPRLGPCLVSDYPDETTAESG